jgi:hypothetical protein
LGCGLAADQQIRDLLRHGHDPLLAALRILIHEELALRQIDPIPGQGQSFPQPQPAGVKQPGAMGNANLESAALLDG